MSAGTFVGTPESSCVILVQHGESSAKRKSLGKYPLASSRKPWYKRCTGNWGLIQ
jgi:hypothetical protein